MAPVQREAGCAGYKRLARRRVTQQAKQRCHRLPRAKRSWTGGRQGVQQGEPRPALLDIAVEEVRQEVE